MSVLSRYAAVAVVVFFAMFLAFALGEVLCETCQHAAGLRGDRGDRLKVFATRMGTALAAVFAPVLGVSVAGFSRPAEALLGPPIALSPGVSLRI